MQRELSVFFRFFKDIAQQKFKGYFGTHMKEDHRRALKSDNGTKTTKQEDHTVTEEEMDARESVIPCAMKSESY